MAEKARDIRSCRTMCFACVIFIEAAMLGYCIGISEKFNETATQLQTQEIIMVKGI